MSIMVFTAQQLADLEANNLKVSADGTINTHSDVQVIDPIIGQVLTWDGTNWTNGPAPAPLTTQQLADLEANNLKVSANGSVNTHNDVEYSLPTQDQVLTWNGTNWINKDQILDTWQTFFYTPPIPVSPISSFYSSVAPQVPTTLVFPGTTERHNAFDWNGEQVAFPCVGGVPLANNNSPTGIKTIWPLLFPLATGAPTSDAYGPTGGKVLKGLEQLYISTNPFLDPENPTFYEYMQWNVQVINLYRRLLGNTIPVILDRRCCNEALWHLERRFGLLGPDTGYTDVMGSYIPSLEIQAKHYKGIPNMTVYCHHMSYRYYNGSVGPAPAWLQMSHAISNSFYNDHYSFIHELWGVDKIGFAMINSVIGNPTSNYKYMFKKPSTSTIPQWCNPP